jgi:hypothetical protein
MTTQARLALDQDMDGLPPDRDWIVELYIVPLYDPKNIRMPYIFALFRGRKAAANYIDHYCDEGRQFIDKQSDPLKYDFLLANGTIIKCETAISLRNATIIPILRSHPINEALSVAHRAKKTLIVSKSGDDENHRFAQEIEAILLRRGFIVTPEPFIQSVPEGLDPK